MGQHIPAIGDIYYDQTTGHIIRVVFKARCAYTYECLVIYRIVEHIDGRPYDDDPTKWRNYTDFTAKKEHDFLNEEYRVPRFDYKPRGYKGIQ